MSHTVFLKHGVFLSAVILGLPALALDFPLTYERHSEEDGGFRPNGYAHIDVSKKPPPGNWTLPALVCKAPVYGVIALGDREHLLVLDQQKEDDSFYNRLYFDANANSDLTDEPAVEGTVEENGPFIEAHFQPLDVTLTVNGKSLPYSFSVNAERYDPGAVLRFVGRLMGAGLDEAYVRAQVNCSYTGEFESGGQRYRVWLNDRNCNGRFDEKPSIFGEWPPDAQIRDAGDTLYLARAALDESRTSQYLGDRLVLSDTLFDVGINIPEQRMTLTPSTGATLPVELTNSFDQLTLCTEDKQHGVMMYQPASTVPLPPGSYRLVNYQIRRNDDQGDRWRLRAVGNADAGVVSVAENEEAVITFGEPYVPLAEVLGGTLRKRFFGGAYANLEFKLEGAGKETVLDVERIAGNNTRIPLSSDRCSPKEATFKATKPDGEVVAQGVFEYG